MGGPLKYPGGPLKIKGTGPYLRGPAIWSDGLLISFSISNPFYPILPKIHKHILSQTTLQNLPSTITSSLHHKYPFGGGSLTFAITQQMMLFKLNQHLNLILMNPFTHITNHPYVHLHSLIITQVHKCLHHQKCHHHFHQITTTLHYHHLPLNT